MENTKTINIFFDYIFSNRFKKYIFFDLGSRDCLEAVEFSKKFPNAIIYSFEPNPSAISIAKQNIKNYPNIKLIEKAVSDINGKIKFYPINPELTNTPHDDGNIGASSIYKASGKYPLEDYIQDEIVVESITLESFCKENNIISINFLWMDLQGAEYLAIKGASKSILKNIELIHTEAENFEIYKGQHFFKDIHRLLKKNFILLSGNTKHTYFDNFIYVNKKYFPRFFKIYIKYKINSLIKHFK